MLHKDYYRKGSVGGKKISGRQSQGAWRQDKLIGGKRPVVKLTLTLTLTFDYDFYERVPRRVGGWCETAASLGVSCETVAGQ
jgi:hypothetical protein